MYLNANGVSGNALARVYQPNLVDGISEIDFGPGFSSIGRSKSVWQGADPSDVLVEKGDSEFAYTMVINQWDIVPGLAPIRCLDNEPCRSGGIRIVGLDGAVPDLLGREAELPGKFERTRRPINLAPGRTKRFESWNEFACDRGDCIPGNEPDRGGGRSGNDFMDGNPIRDLRIDPDPHWACATRKGCPRRFLSLRSGQGDKEDKNDETRNDTSRTQEEMVVSHS